MGLFRVFQTSAAGNAHWWQLGSTACICCVLVEHETGLRACREPVKTLMLINDSFLYVHSQKYSPKYTGSQAYVITY